MHIIVFRPLRTRIEAEHSAGWMSEGWDFAFIRVFRGQNLAFPSAVFQFARMIVFT